LLVKWVRDEEAVFVAGWEGQIDRQMRLGKGERTSDINKVEKERKYKERVHV